MVNLTSAWNLAKKFILNPIRFGIVILLFVSLIFGVVMFGVNYYIHTEQFYEDVNPDVLMAMHEYQWTCTNETTITRLKDVTNVGRESPPSLVVG